jgi:radical SAM protein (TIGR01212 family)
VNAGFTCPNRDGTVGWGGCTYCNNQTFNPDYCETHKTITQQIEEGKQFFARKYPDMKFLAYFQAYTNTYDQLDVLKAKYEEALAVDGVVGLVVGTRPDCVSDELLRYLKDLSARCFVLVEYGVESVSNETLLRINRGHTFEQAVDAIHRTAKIGLPVGAHFILGLPGESWDDIVRSASVISQLPLDTIKLHQLQIVRGTRMAREYQENPKDFTLFSADEYASLVVDFLEHLTTRIAVERFTSQSPAELLLAPNWGLKNYQFVELVKKKLRMRSSYQGKESGAKNLERRASF